MYEGVKNTFNKVKRCCPSSQPHIEEDEYDKKTIKEESNTDTNKIKENVPVLPFEIYDIEGVDDKNDFLKKHLDVHNNFKINKDNNYIDYEYYKGNTPQREEIHPAFLTIHDQLINDKEHYKNNKHEQLAKLNKGLFNVGIMNHSVQSYIPQTQQPYHSNPMYNSINPQLFHSEQYGGLFVSSKFIKPTKVAKPTKAAKSAKAAKPTKAKKPKAIKIRKPTKTLKTKKPKAIKIYNQVLLNYCIKLFL